MMNRNRKPAVLAVPPVPVTDFLFENYGSVTFLTPVSDAAKTWAAENISDKGYQPYADRILIEPRYARPILEGIQAEGMVVR